MLGGLNKTFSPTSKHVGQIKNLIRNVACSSNLFYNLDNTISFGFMCSPFIGSDPSAGERVKTLLSSNWPKNTTIQFTLLGLSDIMHTLDDRLNLRNRFLAQNRFNLTEQHNTLWAIANETDKFFKAGIDRPLIPNTTIYSKDYKLCITFSVPADQGNLATEMVKIREVMNQANAGLRTIGLNPITMNEDQYLRIMSQIVNHSKEASWRKALPIENEPNTELREQIADFNTDVRVDRNGFWLGDTRARVYSPKRYPKMAHFGLAAQYIGEVIAGQRGIYSPFVLSVTLHLGDPATEKQKLETKGQFAQNQRSSQFAKYVSAIGKRAHDFDVLNEAVDNGNSVLRICTTMILFGDSEEEIVQFSSNASSYWSELGYNMLHDRFIALPLFLNALPMGATCDPAIVKETKRYKTMASNHVTTLLPLFADWKGTGSPISTYVSRNGQLMNMSLYDSSTNYNCVVCAQSGAGKSFLINDMINNNLSVGGRTWVIDVGRSYEKLADVLGGKFISFEENSDICINPFPLIKNYQEEEDLLVGLVAAMASQESKLSDFQVANLKKHMSECWEKHGKNMTFDILAQSLLENRDGMNGKPERRIHDLGQQLYPFTTKGSYGRWFNGENNLDLNNNFIVLELEELKGREQLQQVVLLLLIYQIQTEMYLGDKGQQKMVFIDEAWDLLSQGDVSAFIAHGYRRFRKYGGSCTIITQSILDLHDSDVGTAIKSNSANTYLLSQKSDQIDEMKAKQALPLGDGGYELLKTVRTEKGKYSEILFHTADYGSGIGRLVVDPFRSLLYTTNASDVAAIDRYRKQGLSVTDSIYSVMQDQNLMTVAAE